MEVNELRIGNWYIGNDEKKTQWKLEDFSLLTDLDGERPLRIDEIVKSPIPLTEEWLLKFGFDYEKEIDVFTKTDLKYQKIGIRDYSHLKDSGFKIVWVWSDELKHIVNDIKHVHQLQNLCFALTGEELKLIS